MHRDYQANMPTRLYQYDNHIEIMNPGGLYGQARPENFPHVNDYRNSVVAGIMKTLNYVNMFNHGIGEVQELLRQNNSPEAEFNVDYLTAFSVIVKENVTNDVTKEVTNELTERQRLILNLMRNNSYVTIREMSQKTGVVNRTILRDIESLQEKGIIVREGGNKSGYWKIIIDKA